MLYWFLKKCCCNLFCCSLKLKKGQKPKQRAAQNSNPTSDNFYCACIDDPTDLINALLYIFARKLMTELSLWDLQSADRWVYIIASYIDKSIIYSCQQWTLKHILLNKASNSFEHFNRYPLKDGYYLGLSSDPTTVATHKCTITGKQVALFYYVTGYHSNKTTC